MAAGSVEISARCYSKMMLHAAKYPHAALNGLLLAAPGRPHRVLECVPLFHQCVWVSPMAEVALAQVEAAARGSGLALVGYYAASDNYKDNSFERAPAVKIADKISEHCPNALLIVIDNRQFSMNFETIAIKVAQFSDGKWKPKDPSCIKVDESTVMCTSGLMKCGAHKVVVDFDNHLDDISADWSNKDLNRQIDETAKLMKDLKSPSED